MVCFLNHGDYQPLNVSETVKNDAYFAKSDDPEELLSLLIEAVLDLAAAEEEITNLTLTIIRMDDTIKSLRQRP